MPFYVAGGMGDAPFGTNPVPYSYPDGNSRSDEQRGQHPHLERDPTTHVWSQTGELDLGQFRQARSHSFETQMAIVSGHPSGNGLRFRTIGFASVNTAVYVAPCAAGLAISNDGTCWL